MSVVACHGVCVAELASSTDKIIVSTSAINFCLDGSVGPSASRPCNAFSRVGLAKLTYVAQGSSVASAAQLNFLVEVGANLIVGAAVWLCWDTAAGVKSAYVAAPLALAHARTLCAI